MNQTVRSRWRAVAAGGASLAVIAAGAVLAPASAADGVVLNLDGSPMYVEQGGIDTFTIQKENGKADDTYTVKLDHKVQGATFTISSSCEPVKGKNLTWLCTQGFDGPFNANFQVEVAKDAPQRVTTVSVTDHQAKKTVSDKVYTGKVVDFNTQFSFPSVITYNAKTGVVQDGLTIDIYNNGPQTGTVKLTLEATKNAEFFGKPTSPQHKITACPTVSSKKVVCFVEAVPELQQIKFNMPTRLLSGKKHNFAVTFAPVKAWDKDPTNNSSKASYSVDFEKPKPTQSPTPTQKPTTSPTPTQKPTTSPTPTQKPTTSPTPTQPTSSPTSTPTQTETTAPLPTKVPAGLVGPTDHSDSGGPGAGLFGGVAAGLAGLIVLAGALRRRRGHHEA